MRYTIDIDIDSTHPLLNAALHSYISLSVTRDNAVDADSLSAFYVDSQGAFVYL